MRVCEDDEGESGGRSQDTHFRLLTQVAVEEWEKESQAFGQPS